MTAANDTVATIGPATERRIQMAFADACIITAQAAAKLLGMDAGTLRELTEEGVIRAVRRGARRAYTEGDIRCYLTQADAPVREEKQRPTVHVQSKVVPFSQRRTKARG